MSCYRDFSISNTFVKGVVLFSITLITFLFHVSQLAGPWILETSGKGNRCSLETNDTKVAFIAYGQLSDSLLTFSKNWTDALGMIAEVDIFYSVPLKNALGDKVTDKNIQELRDHLLSLKGTSSVYIEQSGIDFTHVASALVQKAGEPFFLHETNSITQRLWSQFLAMSSSIEYFSLLFPSACYDIIVVGRFNALDATNLNLNKCIDATKRDALPLLRPPPLEYMIEDRIMAIPPCLLTDFGKALSDPARLFLNSHFELNMSYPKLRVFELFVQNAFKIAVRAGACKRKDDDVFEPTCVDNIWSIPVNVKKYERTELVHSKNTYDLVRDQLLFEHPNFDDLFGPKGASLFNLLTLSDSNRVKRMHIQRENCVQSRVSEVQALQESLGWVEGLEASLNGPYKPQLRSVALIVPVHPPKFKWVVRLVEDHIASDFLWDLLFVFSSSSDAVYFESILKQDLRGTYSALVMPVVNAKVNDDVKNGIVTIKKWWALALTHTCYEFVCFFDAETSITAPKLFANAVRESAGASNVYQGYLRGVPEHLRCYSINEEFVCNPSDFHAPVMGSIAMLPSAMIEIVAKETKNCSLYSRFSDIPIYITSDVKSFFSDVNWPRFLPGFCAFDHLIYQMWKIARREWQSIDLTGDSLWPKKEGDDFVWELPELQKDPILWENVRNRHYPGSQWRPWQFCKYKPNLCTEDSGVVAIFHLDRDF